MCFAMSEMGQGRPARGNTANEAAQKPVTQTGDNPCLVYVQGPKGLEAQIWYEPMVRITPDGTAVVTINPENIKVVGKPYRLPANQHFRPWTPDEADQLVKAETKAA